MGDLVKRDFVHIVDTSPPPYCYLKATLEYEGKMLETDPLQFKHILMQALTEVFGQIGASITVDLLKLSASGQAVLRVPSGAFERLWAAMTMFGKYKDQVCAFKVQQVSTCLLSLASNSRTWEIPKADSSTAVTFS